MSLPMRPMRVSFATLPRAADEEKWRAAVVATAEEEELLKARRPCRMLSIVLIELFGLTIGEISSQRKTRFVIHERGMN